MAAIVIRNSTVNRTLAEDLVQQNGALMDNNGAWITVEQSPVLRVPRGMFDAAYKTSGDGATKAKLEKAWASFVMNRKGHLITFSAEELVISDEKPKKTGQRDNFLVRFVDDEKVTAEHYSEVADMTLTDYIRFAVQTMNNIVEKETESR